MINDQGFIRTFNDNPRTISTVESPADIVMKFQDLEGISKGISSFENRPYPCMHPPTILYKLARFCLSGDMCRDVVSPSPRLC
jgi:hypothetical protein